MSKTYKRKVYMSTFPESLEKSMRSIGLSVPRFDDPTDALELVHKLQQAVKNSDDEVMVTIGALITAGGLAGVDEGELIVLGEGANVAAASYVSACIACLASVAMDDLRGLFASNQLSDFVVAELNSQGINLTRGAVA